MANTKIMKDAKLRTIRVDEELWLKVKAAAQKDDRTLSSWVRQALERAVRDFLARR